MTRNKAPSLSRSEGFPICGYCVQDNYLRLQVLTAVTMNSTIFWDATLCSLIEVHRRFGGTYGLHLQTRLCRLLVSDYLPSLLLDSEDEDSTSLRNVDEVLLDYATLPFRT
jgi:hypothetical protein